MGLNVSTTMGFENYDFMKNNAKDILGKGGASSETTSKIIDSTVFTFENPQLSVIKASTQISINNTLNETLKYLKTHAYKKASKRHILGELWSIVSTQNEESNPYRGELYDFQIDKSAKNIFAA